MNDDRTIDRDVRDVLEEHAPMQPPNHLLQSFEFNAQRKRRYPRWLALVKEPSMRTDSHIAVGSPTVRLASIILATLLLAAGIIGAGFAGSQLLAAGGPIIVDADGGGHYTTIQEAVAAAVDGDEILIKPGTYSGPVDIEKDISVSGDDRDRVILEFGYGCTVDDATDITTCPDESWLYDQFFFDPWPYGVALIETNARLSDITIRKPEDVGGSGFVVRGGSPYVSGITYAGEGDFGNIYIHGDSTAVIADSEFGPMWVFFEDGAPATIENSTTHGSIRMHAPLLGAAEPPSDLAPQVARDNSAGTIVATGPAEITGNTFVYDPVLNEVEPLTAIDATGFGSAVIAGNQITGYQSGIYGFGRSDTVIVDHNTLVDNENGISGFGGADLTITDNEINGGQTGITASGVGLIADNVIEGAIGRGLVISTSADVTVSGNRACGNGEDLFVAPRATVEIDDTNEFCVVASTD